MSVAAHSALAGLSLEQGQLTVIITALDEVYPDHREVFLADVGERLRHWSRIRDDQVHTAVADALHGHAGPSLGACA